MIFSLAMIVEGDLFLFTAAFLTHHGYFGFTPMFLAIYGGVVAGDSLWYYLGTIVPRFPRIYKIMDKITGRAHDHLESSPFRTLFISKFIYNFHHPMLMRAGWKRLNYGKFLKNNIIANLAWVIAIGSLGYIFSASFVLVGKYIKIVEIGLFLGIVFLILFEKFVLGRKLGSKV